MRFSVGLQWENEPFLAQLLARRDRVDEAYFAWPGFASGRGRSERGGVLSGEELTSRVDGVLRRLREAGIGLNLLFNADCYGADALARSFYQKIGDTVDLVRSRYGLSSVTTTSPVIARFLRENFPGLHLRASVNMEIGTVDGMSLLADLFDSFYMARDYNRDMERVRALSDWCRENGKGLYLLANSGCLNFCPAHHFHDNLVAHDDEIARRDNAFAFEGLCRARFRDPARLPELYDRLNFIRPEEVCRYEGLADGMKLATRVSRAASEILIAYTDGRFAGDLLSLLEPAHNVFPYVLENGDPPRLIRVTDER